MARSWSHFQLEFTEYLVFLMSLSCWMKVASLSHFHVHLWTAIHPRCLYLLLFLALAKSLCKACGFESMSQLMLAERKGCLTMTLNNLCTVDVRKLEPYTKDFTTIEHYSMLKADDKM